MRHQLIRYRIQSAFRGPEFAVLGNRTAVRQGFIEPLQLEQALQHKVGLIFLRRTSAERADIQHVTSKNAEGLRRYLLMTKEGWRAPAAIPWYVALKLIGLQVSARPWQR